MSNYIDLIVHVDVITYPCHISNVGLAILRLLTH